MGVYVRMQMPKNCYDCTFCRHYDEPNQGYCCVAWLVDLHNVDIQKERCQVCPLVEVPEPHGRLGDLDALLKKCEFVCTDDDVDVRAVRYSVVDAAPTVIPADESDMDSFIRIFEEDDEEDGMDSFIQILKD